LYIEDLKLIECIAMSSIFYNLNIYQKLLHYDYNIKNIILIYDYKFHTFNSISNFLEKMSLKFEGLTIFKIIDKKNEDCISSLSC